MTHKNTTYKRLCESHQKSLLENSFTGFDGAHGGGIASWKDDTTHEIMTGKSRKTLIASDRDKNLYQGIRTNAKQYMAQYDIDWWHMEAESPKEITCNTLSSQVSCLNHLFPFRKDDSAIKLLLKSLTNIEFDTVCPSPIDKDGYITFEFVYDNAELLSETDEGAKRGSLCTSIDATIIAQKGEEKWIFPIEWKYTEDYGAYDKTNKTRLERYGHLIAISEQLQMPTDGVAHSLYMQEPYNELMRQTLLMEQMKRKGIVDHFIHINVIPKGNKGLRNKVERNYVPMLKDPSKFICITPQDLLAPLKDDNSALFTYLQTRYWN